ncbi:unnamed protein product [Paramecium pentaurelia]|uniref:Uncharacterized protein n=1 Tax=Paramecium pentaurelia TaxID=43138 RepID=A0A8S1W364_9CILI|nr:unnamed protein product [Paramecium pentaurelia]
MDKYQNHIMIQWIIRIKQYILNKSKHITIKKLFNLQNQHNQNFIIFQNLINSSMSKKQSQSLKDEILFNLISLQYFINRRTYELMKFSTMFTSLCNKNQLRTKVQLQFLRVYTLNKNISIENKCNKKVQEKLDLIMESLRKMQIRISQQDLDIYRQLNQNHSQQIDMNKEQMDILHLQKVYKNIFQSGEYNKSKYAQNQDEMQLEMMNKVSRKKLQGLTKMKS